MSLPRKRTIPGRASPRRWPASSTTCAGGSSEGTNRVRGTGSALDQSALSDTEELRGDGKVGSVSEVNPKNSGLFVRNRLVLGGGCVTTTVVAFVFMFDFSTFPGGLGKAQRSRSPEKSPLGK